MANFAGGHRSDEHVTWVMYIHVLVQSARGVTRCAQSVGVNSNGVPVRGVGHRATGDQGRARCDCLFIHDHELKGFVGRLQART